jgi:glycosyltransferase involved in cell wall biosynthesis
MIKTKCESEVVENWHGSEVYVSICCTAYNHEKYIEYALKGFLMQETNFAFEIIISDDCSTDATAEIIKKYTKKYPNIIKPILLTENQYSKGALPIRDFILPSVSGKYIALCEGDDYWTDPNKLQLQIDFLEQNQSFIGCGHNTKFLKNRSLTDELFVDPNDHKESYQFEDFIDSAYMHTTSLVLRYNSEYKTEIDSYLKKYSNVDRNDVYMLLVFSNFGPIKYFNKVMSVYRMNDGGIWSGAQDEDQLIMFLQGCVDFSHLFDEKYRSKFLYSFANTLSEEKDKQSDEFVDKVLSKLNIYDYKIIIKYFAMFKKSDNETIKDCSEYIAFLENHMNDNSFKSLIIKFVKFMRFDNIFKKKPKI